MPISFIGTQPFIAYNPIGGREFKVVAELAKKFRFLPNFIPMTSFGDGTDGLGMTHHVAMKQSELGIGQSGIAFNERRFVVDNLPWMSVYEWPIQNVKPKEIASFGTLVYPVDTYTWALVFGAVAAEFIILIILQLVWSNVAENPTPKDFVYQGEKLENMMYTFCRY